MTNVFLHNFSKAKIFYQKRKPIILIFLVAFLFSYAVEKTRLRHELIRDSVNLISVISEPLERVSSIVSYVGQKIANNNKSEDLNYIHNLFKETALLHSSFSNIISNPMFAWCDKNYNLALATANGIFSKTEDLSSNSYVWYSKDGPWKMQMSFPGPGLISKTWILPAGVNIRDEKDNFLGTIVFGINIKELNNRAQNVLKSGNSFILANRDSLRGEKNRIIFASANSPMTAKDYDKIPRLVDWYKDGFDIAGSTLTDINAGRFKFNYYRVIEGYPLVILMGFNRIEFWLRVFYSTLGIAGVFLILRVCLKFEEVE